MYMLFKKLNIIPVNMVKSIKKWGNNKKQLECKQHNTSQRKKTCITPFGFLEMLISYISNVQLSSLSEYFFYSWN